MVVALVVFGGMAGWSSIQGRRFEAACLAIAEGDDAAEAEASLVARRGRRVFYSQQAANETNFTFRSMVGPDRTCQLEAENGVVVRASRFRQAKPAY